MIFYLLGTKRGLLEFRLGMTFTLEKTYLTIIKNERIEPMLYFFHHYYYNEKNV